MVICKLNHPQVFSNDPCLSPALFTLTIRSIISQLHTDLNIWYPDDGCITGGPNTT